MSRLKPEKLSVEFRKGVTTTEPIIPRRYTLTPSYITADLFLTIGITNLKIGELFQTMILWDLINIMITYPNIITTIDINGI